VTVLVCRAIEVKSLTWDGDAKDSIKIWAKQMIELAKTPRSHKVDDASSYNFSPW
jgi:hypothetical protein